MPNQSARIDLIIKQLMLTGIYNIASRAAPLNSVYVSVVQIPIVLANSVRKSLRQNFFARAASVS